MSLAKYSIDICLSMGAAANSTSHSLTTLLASCTIDASDKEPFSKHKTSGHKIKRLSRLEYNLQVD